MPKILIVDDEAAIRRSFRDVLEFEDFQVDEAADGMEAVAKVKSTSYDVVICDIKMPKMDGLEFLERSTIIAPDVPIIMISGHGNIDTAVEAVKKGAFDFIPKPLDLNRLLITVRNAMDKSSLIVEAKVLKKKVAQFKTPEIVGQSSSIEHIKQTIDKIAPTDARIMILGPNGTGKELVARWIHEKSNRNELPLIEVNCAAIPSELIESELFGHEKGAFTSAIKQRIGKFEQANGGTLFLDEIGDMSLSAQAKVLRALQENRITRVGGEKEIKVDVRVIAATNKDLRKEIAAGRFREDLYHRLAVIIIQVPALDNRKDDIPILVDHFIQIVCNDYGISPKKITPEAIKILQSLSWTGNIRELRNVVERLIILSNDKITDQDVRSFVSPTMSQTPTLQELFEQYDSFEPLKNYIEKAYKEYKQDIN
jgi:DNA-binding NtrC family response regulator